MSWKQAEGHLPLGISTPATMVVGAPRKKNPPRNYQEPAWERVFEDTTALRISTWDHPGLTPRASDIATDISKKRKGADTDGAMCEQSGDQVWGGTPVNKEGPKITSKDQNLGARHGWDTPRK